MKLIIRQLAVDPIEEVENWVEKQNTIGVGKRWTIRLIETLTQKAKTGVKHAICKSKGLSRYGHRCFTYNEKWVVAYKISGDKFMVYRFIYGAKLQ